MADEMLGLLGYTTVVCTAAAQALA